ncbi:hypothetical protein EG68_05149 [Paragonimus skrjabini miyazakii]|uniref:Matrix-remodeling-associated protein 7 helical domain-containing protein n=1 Tax=Paragonimus skrjabini miyazakii TaxID=59628 RepID=A0A8S9YRP1_9TREM|nr:hypothetical protein EG68_05149 [Paragonimus skrjabini miyazakii]
MVHAASEKPTSVLTLSSVDFLITVLTTLFLGALVRKLVLLSFGRRRKSLITPLSPTADAIGSSNARATSQLGSTMLNNRPLPAFLNGVENVNQLLASCPFMAALQANEENSATTNDSCDNVGIRLNTSENAVTKPSSPSKRPDGASSGPQQLINGSPELSSTKRFGQPTPAPQITVTLSEEEEAEERQACLAQLDRIHALMQSQPDRFGTVSVADMRQQMSHYYYQAEESALTAATDSSQ